MGPLLKRVAITSALEAIALFRLWRFLPGASGRGVIFTLHHVRPAANQVFNPNRHLEVTPEFLEQAILAAKEAGLEPARLEDLPALLAEPGSNRKYVCFTLDDGYRNNAGFAAPVFRKHGVPYTIFICPGFVTRTRTVWWETGAELLRRVNTFRFDFGAGEESVPCASEAEKMAAFERLAELVDTKDENEAVARIDALALTCGFDPVSYVEREVMDEADLAQLAVDPLVSFGGHTLTHCNLARVSPERLQAEISESCRMVSSYSGQKARSFSYPYGWKSACGQREFDAAEKEGVSVAVTTQPGVLSAAANPAALPRVSLNGLYQKKRYVRALISGVGFKHA